MIKLSDKWRMNADDRCYILEEHFVNKKTGEDRWTPQFYYATVAGALVGYRKNVSKAKISSCNDIDIQEFIDCLREIDSEFIANIKDICDQCKEFDK